MNEGLAFNYTSIPLMNTISSLPPEIVVIILSLMPGVEPRYAVVVGVILGLGFYESLLLSLLSLIILSTLLTLFIGYIDKVLASLTASKGVLSKIAILYMKIRSRSASRARRSVEKWGLLGLIGFIAIPLPATGVYTGALASLILGIRGLKLLGALILGGVISMIITSIMTNIIL